MIKLDRNIVKDKIYACWLGKNIGGTMGAPYEGDSSMHDITGFSTPKGQVLPNDDLDLQLVWLCAVEDAGPAALTPQVLGEYWMSHIYPHWNEYGICKNNMRMGILPPMSGEYNNPWKHSNGAWIRTEVWACMAPGRPDIAIKYAWMDAAVDHGTGEGTYAAMFVAAIEASAFIISDPVKLTKIGLSVIPPECRKAQAIQVVLDCREKGLSWKEAREKVVESTKDLGWFQAPANVSFAIIGLLWGEGDFKKSMIISVNCGDDTDCTAATVGSILGIIGGSNIIPDDWSEYIGDGIANIATTQGTLYYIPTTCSELTERVYAMIPEILRANDNHIHSVNAKVRLSGGDVVLADENEINDEDMALIIEHKTVDAAKKLIAIPGNSYNIDFIWAECLVIMPEGPECTAGKPFNLKFVLKNHDDTTRSPKFCELKWFLPEGWRVEGARKNYVLQVKERHVFDETEFEAVIIPGDNVEPVNRIWCEITDAQRPTKAMIPIVLIG